MRVSDTFPVRDGLFAIVEGGTPLLITGRCNDCARLHFPQQSTCPYCAATTVTQELLDGEASLWTWTSVLREPPGYRGPVPFGFGVVELEAGIRIVTRLTESDPRQLTAGMPMRLVVDDLHTDDEGRVVQTYAFAPVTDMGVPPDTDPPGADGEAG
ncbi:MAG: OB-fold domain-containing protein [Acidimicrobiia bacterium]|nr:OB-fold domain-containing protein [Acidimicrobiia bacterium]